MTTAADGASAGSITAVHPDQDDRLLIADLREAVYELVYYLHVGADS
jgi:hypothetical protein